MKCQCPKPDYFIQHDRVIPILPTDLHYKKADRECSRCGNPLCADCAEIKFLDDDYGKVYHKEYCRACKEDK